MSEEQKKLLQAQLWNITKPESSVSSILEQTVDDERGKAITSAKIAHVQVGVMK